MRMIALIFMLCFSGVAYAGSYPSQFDANGLVSYFHQLGPVQFKKVYDGHRIIIRGTIKDIDYAPVGAQRLWISINLKHKNDKGPFKQLTLWFAQKYEAVIRKMPNKIEASCIVQPGIRLPALWSCVPSKMTMQTLKMEK